MTQETPARNAAPLVHPDLIAPIRYRELQATWILGVKQIAVRVINRPGDMQFNVRLCGIIVMQDVAILREKDVECVGIVRQVGNKSFVRNNTALSPPAIRDLRGCGQLRRSSSTLKTW
jgi:hypothetical protein